MKFRDLQKQYNVLKNDIDNAISKVISDTNFILGTEVGELEKKLAEYVNRKYCITCGNGTDALILALKAYGIKKGDAVFVPDFTYIASASCVSNVDATPVFVDIDLNTFNMSPSLLEKMIEKTISEKKLTPRAIIPVDLFGLPADYDAILQIAKKYNLLVIEDAAQGFGGRIQSKVACSFGDISCTSFFPAKPLGCYGDGGAIFTDDKNIDEYLRSIRAGGKSPLDKYDNIRIGVNSRLDTLQAAILNVKFDAFKNYEINDVNKNAKLYDDKLKGYFKIPYIPNSYVSSYAQYTILCENELQRNIVQKKLKENDIPSMIYYSRCMHEQKCFADLNSDNSLYINSIEAAKRVLSLPIGPYITESDINIVCKNLISAI